MPRPYPPGAGDDRSPLIVLVEDHDDTLWLYTELLRAEGYRVDAFVSGEGVVERVLQEIPAALILDIGLPGEDGVTICRRLRGHQECEALPIIAVSAWLGLRHPQYSIPSALFSEMLTKPIEPPRLLDVIRRWVPPPPRV